MIVEPVLGVVGSILLGEGPERFFRHDDARIGAGVLEESRDAPSHAEGAGFVQQATGCLRANYPPG